MKEGHQEGRQEGRQEGVRDMVLEALQIRFGNVSEAIVTRLNEIEDIDTLRKLHRQALLADSLDVFAEALE